MKRKINKILRMIRNSFIEFLQRPIVVNASLSIDKTGEVYHSNWGDDINSFFSGSDFFETRCVVS